jgi:hypothetical protein
MKWFSILLLLTVPAIAQNVEPPSPLVQSTLPIDPYMSKPSTNGGAVFQSNGSSISFYTIRCPSGYVPVWTGFAAKCAKDLIDPQ